MERAGCSWSSVDSGSVECPVCTLATPKLLQIILITQPVNFNLVDISRATTELSQGFTRYLSSGNLDIPLFVPSDHDACSHSLIISYSVGVDVGPCRQEACKRACGTSSNLK